MSDTLSTQDVVDLLKIGKNQVLDLVARGVLPCAQLGKRFVYMRDDVLAYLRAEIDRQTAQRRAPVVAIQPRRRGGQRRLIVPGE